MNRLQRIATSPLVAALMLVVCAYFVAAMLGAVWERCVK